MQLDSVQLGFSFAKELAIQLITLSTGLLALSVTFAKDILKTVPGRTGKKLKIAWVLHLVSILFGVWTLMALTGTLMPVHPNPSSGPLHFEFNVRGPAALQVFLFLLGTVFLVVVYGWGSVQQPEEEFRLVVVPPDQLATELNRSKVDR